MIQLLRNMFFDEHAQFLYVVYKACIRIRIAFYGDQQLVVMSMPVIIRAFSKYFVVFFPAPCRIIQFMRCIEMLHPCEKNHQTEISAKIVKVSCFLFLVSVVRLAHYDKTALPS